MNKECSIELKLKVPVKSMLVLMNIFSANEQRNVQSPNKTNNFLRTLDNLPFRTH